MDVEGTTIEVATLRKALSEAKEKQPKKALKGRNKKTE